MSPGFVSVIWSPYFTLSFRTPFSLFLFPGLLFPLLLFPLPSLFTFHFSSLLLFPPSLFPIQFFIFSSFPNVIPPCSLPYSFPCFPSLSLSLSFPIPFPFSLFLFSIPTFPFSSFTFFLSRSFLLFYHSLSYSTFPYFSFMSIETPVASRDKKLIPLMIVIRSLLLYTDLV